MIFIVIFDLIFHTNFMQNVSNLVFHIQLLLTNIFHQSQHMYHTNKNKIKRNTLKDSSQQLLLYLNSCSINDKDLFLKKQYADFYLIIKKTNKMYPLISRCVIHNCGLFRANRGEKCIFIQQSFKEEDITNILSLMYGYSLIFDRSRVKEYFAILEKLQFDYIIKMLKNDILSSFEAYDIFVLLEIANEYRIFDIMERCKAQLLKENFQQLRYNLYDLLQCSQEVFRMVINFHNQSQRQQQIRGLLSEQISDIIHQYINQNLNQIKGSILLAELMGRNRFTENMVSSKIYTFNPIVSFIQQSKLTETKRTINSKPQTFYSQILAEIERSVHMTPNKYKEKGDIKSNFEQKAKFIQASRSPGLKKRDSQYSDCDSMVKTRLPTQSTAMTIRKSSKQKGTYKPWEAKKNPQTKDLGSPKIKKQIIPFTKNISEQSTMHRSPYKLQKKEIKSNHTIEEPNDKESYEYFKKRIQTQIKPNNLTDRQYNYQEQKRQISNRKKSKIKEKFIENPISPIFESITKSVDNSKNKKSQRQEVTTKQFLLDPNSIKQVSQMEDSSYMEHASLLNKIQIEAKSQIKSVKKIPKLSQKTSIQFLLNKAARKTSYEATEMKMDRQYIPPNKKSPILKEIQQLNKQCQNIQQQNVKLMQEVKSIKLSFVRKEVQRKQYKENLIQIDKMLHNLQRQFEAQNQQLRKISAKIQKHQQRDSNNGLLNTSFCQSISDNFF